MPYRLDYVSVGDPHQPNVSTMKCSQPLIKPIRFCPICLTSMSWLPKFAACPMCGMKPMPVVEEINLNNQLTADQILTDCLGKTQENVECEDPCTSMNGKRDRETSKVDSNCGHCTCKSGKECAHCRIRKLWKIRKYIPEFCHTAKQSSRTKISHGMCTSAVKLALNKFRN